MQDTIIKGTGNSRSLASVPNFLTMYPTYGAFAQALIAGEVPIDIGPINPSGVDVLGTANNQANLLPGDVAAMLGADTVGKALRVLAARDIYATSYVGTNTNTSESNPMMISFPFAPKLVIAPVIYDKNMIPSSRAWSSQDSWIVDMGAVPTSYTKGSTFGFGRSGGSPGDNYGKKSLDGKTLYWYKGGGTANNYTESWNDSRYRYRFLAFT